MSSPIVGPIAPQSNPPINPQYFQPSRFVIDAIVLGATTQITTTVDHNYVVGQTVRILIPETYGSVQLNGRTGNIISIPAADQVVIAIYSLDANAFDAAGTNTTVPQIIAIGDINSGQTNSSGRVNTGTYILGSFINISPA